MKCLLTGVSLTDDHHTSTSSWQNCSLIAYIVCFLSCWDFITENTSIKRKLKWFKYVTRKMSLTIRAKMILAFALHNKNRYDNKYRLSSLWFLLASLPGLLFANVICNAKLLYIYDILNMKFAKKCILFSLCPSLCSW